MIGYLSDIPPGLDLVGPAGLVVILFYLLATGKLVTRREADGIRKDRDEWHAAFNASEADSRLAARQVDELLEHAKVSAALLKGISEVAQREKP